MSLMYFAGDHVYSDTPKSYSVWVGDLLCEEIRNPYIAGTPNLASTRRTRNCYFQLPYICEKPENPAPGTVTHYDYRHALC